MQTQKKRQGKYGKNSNTFKCKKSCNYFCVNGRPVWKNFRMNNIQSVCECKSFAYPCIINTRIYCFDDGERPFTSTSSAINNVRTKYNERKKNTKSLKKNKQTKGARNLKLS